MNKYTITFKSGLVFVTQADTIIFEDTKIKFLIDGYPNYCMASEDIFKIKEKIQKNTCNN